MRGKTEQGEFEYLDAVRFDELAPTQAETSWKSTCIVKVLSCVWKGGLLFYLDLLYKYVRLHWVFVLGGTRVNKINSHKNAPIPMTKLIPAVANRDAAICMIRE